MSLRTSMLRRRYFPRRMVGGLLALRAAPQVAPLPAYPRPSTTYMVRNAARSLHMTSCRTSAVANHDAPCLPGPNLWLRDNCPCPQCVDPDSGQKNFSTWELPDHPPILSSTLKADGSLTITWANDHPSNATVHVSTYPAALLAHWRTSGLSSPHVLPAQRLLWDRSAFSNLPLSSRSMSFTDWTSGPTSPAHLHALATLARTGLFLITDVPRSEASILAVARAIGPAQDTFYGLTWDVRAKPRAENVAYTNAFLGLHQDLQYVDDSPRLQFLHCLDNDCAGGESLFSDGVRAAYELRESLAPDVKDMMGRKVWNFHYNKSGHRYWKRRALVDFLGGENGMVERVSFSPPFQAPLDLSIGNAEAAAERIGRIKTATTAFQKLVQHPDNMVERKMKPGECVVFDNQRVLHGRRRFGGGGSRWLKGCYVSEQVYRASLIRVAEAGQATVEFVPDVESEWVGIARREREQVIGRMGRR